MKQLLVPTDFSDNAYVAAQYACQLAAANEAHIHLLHVQTQHSNHFANINFAQDDPAFIAAKAAMETLQEKITSAFPALSITSIFRHGVLEEQIQLQCEKQEYSCLVMGTKGSSGLESIFLGSNTYDAILNAQTPVLAIPKNATQLVTDHIALLCNFKEGELEVVKQATAVYGKNFHLKLIHINVDNEPIASLDKKLKQWIERIILETGNEDISYTIKDISYFANSKESIFQSIQTILRDEEVNIILVTKSRKTYFQKVFTENVVKSLAYNITLPNFFGRVK